ncbi:proton-coupled zinc antiporter SLC30A2-like [Bolinopsis microptera]|uniref:proton-coupled zinc antiporter SLC30A2-like n=1 Tax=Bolinopsis microptera TaxID=2820187 RepID=UPI00307A7E99
MKTDFKSPLLPTKASSSDYGSLPPSDYSKTRDTGYILAGKCSTFVEKAPTTNKARNQLIVAAVICLFFTTAEALGGYFSNSLAIFTDASHMMIDFIGYAISLTAIWIAKRPATRKMTFGWYRAEVIGALMSVFTIWVVTGILLYLAVLRIINPDYELDANPMLITACLGVFVNIIMGIVLLPDNLWKKDEEGVEKEKVNINVRAAFIHVLGDLVQSLGVVVGSLIIKFKPEWKLADPICTFVFAILVLITTINILKDALSVLMEGTPEEVEKEQMMEDLVKISGVAGVHSLHVWSLTMDKNVISVHLNVEEDQCGRYSDILQNAKTVISKHSDFHEMTVQLEPPSSITSSSCPKKVAPKSVCSDNSLVCYQSSEVLSQ